MFNSLDIDLFKDGYDINVMDCIDIPIAAMAGFYQHENYYYYSLLFSVKSNWGEDVFDNCCNLKADYFNTRNKLLNDMGLLINVHPAASSTEMLEIVKRSISDSIPVMLIIKYKTLFYYRYYMHLNGDRPHALVIDEWNPETSVLRIRDSAFLRDTNAVATKADVMFPLRVTEEMVSTIWETANKEFIEQKHIFSNSVYSMISKRDVCDNSYEKIIEVILSECNFEDSVLVKLISNFNSRIEYIKCNIVMVRRFFYGGLIALFTGIERWLKEENCVAVNLDSYYSFKEGYLKFRNITLTKLHKYASLNRKLTDKEAENLIEKVINYDSDLFALIKELNHQYKLYKSHLSSKTFKVKVDDYCNNEAFAMSDAAGSTADITDKGVFFIASKLPSDGIYNINGIRMNIVAKKSDGQRDNISCAGQEIDIKEGEYSRIVFLGCSEYGSYCEKLKLCLGSDIVEEAEIKMSDFFESPLFGEETVWRGKAAERTDAGISILNFNGRIFLSQSDISKNKINKIILPERKNIHLFAITLIE